MFTGSMTKLTGSPMSIDPRIRMSMNWLVFGAGAIGTYIGGSLLRGGHLVTFLEQPAVADQIRQRGLHLLLDQQPVHIPVPRLSASLEDALRYAPYDAAIFALKSFDTQSALAGLIPYRHALPPLICLQNGVENENTLAVELGEAKVIAGTVTSSIGRRAAGDIVLERWRGMGLAKDHPLSNQFVQSFNTAGLNARLFSSAADMKWSKMLTNLVGNATSAILDMTPAKIFAHPGLYRLEIQQLRETLAVMNALNIRVVNLPGVPVQLLAMAADWLPTIISSPLLQRAVGSGRGAKMPSLHIDLISGRAQSEVDYLNGAVVRAGQRCGVPVPVNHLLNQTLLGLVTGSQSRETFKQKPEALLNIFADQSIV
jgi:2-dehydropantoate 2-reductase